MGLTRPKWRAVFLCLRRRLTACSPRPARGRGEGEESRPHSPALADQRADRAFGGGDDGAGVLASKAISVRRSELMSSCTFTPSSFFW